MVLAPFGGRSQVFSGVFECCVQALLLLHYELNWAEVFSNERSVHNVRRDPCLPAELQEEWGVPRCFLRGGPVSKGDSGELVIPIPLVFRHPLSEHAVHRGVESFYVPIGGWFIW